MTVDLSKKQIQTTLIDESEQTMATSTMTATNHYKTNISMTASQDSMELSSKLSQLHLRERQQKFYEDNNIPRRQPTIVCEDIADDIDIENESFCSDEQTLEAIAATDQSNDAIGGESLPRSASTASLSVPHSVECEDEKRRPPLPSDDSTDQTQEQMLIEATELSLSS